jgi:hypothetical protein
MLVSLKTFTNSKDYSESCIVLFQLSLLSLVDFIQCTRYIHGLLPEQISGSQRRRSEQLLESQAAFGKPEQASLKRVTRRVFTISK